MRLHHLFVWTVIACVVIASSYPIMAQEEQEQIDARFWADEDDLNPYKTCPHIVVVGGGLAGLTASLSLMQENLCANVTLLEQAKSVGGNSAKASSGINGAGTEEQSNVGVEDTWEAFMEDTLNGLSDEAHGDKVELLTRRSRDAVSWLVNKGASLNLLSQCGGHSVKRTHRNYNDPNARPMNVGYHLVSTVETFLRKYFMERLTIRVNTRATALVTAEDDPTRVTGVKVFNSKIEKKGAIDADIVILTSGGYGADSQGLLKEFLPDLKLATTNAATTLGDGIKLARDIGAELFQMQNVQVHPTGLVDPADPTAIHKLLGPEAMRGLGGILLNRKGERFVNEVGLRKDVTAAIFAENVEFQPFPDAEPAKENNNSPLDLPRVAYLVMTEEVVNRFGVGPVGFYQKRGLVQKAYGFQELATLLQIDSTSLLKTMIALNAAFGDGDAFGRPIETIVKWPEDEKDQLVPFYVAMVTPVIHYTMGGLDTTYSGRVVLADQTDTKQSQNEKRTFSNLYAAGEVSSGVHGDNRLAGNSLLECVVFGRHVARSALDDYEAAFAPNTEQHVEL